MFFLQDTRKLAVSVVKAAFGGTRRKIGWGIEENKPEWWPEHVPWTKRGVQSGVNIAQLRDIIKACYEHFGQTCNVGIIIYLQGIYKVLKSRKFENWFLRP